MNIAFYFTKRMLAALLLAGACVASAQTVSVKKTPPLSEAPAKKAGMSAERLALLDRMLAKAVEEGDIPGVVALVARHGKIVYWKAHGMADNSTGRELKRDDIFRIASQTKAVAATAVMILWEEGKFRLDDPISKYIPEFKNPTVLDTYESPEKYTTKPAKSEITIRHLLTHTSGIGYGEIDGDARFRDIYRHAGIIDLATTKPITIGENIKKLAKLPLHHNPGERFTYSEGLDVLGYLVEVVSGKTFDAFLRERLFEPLGMTDTYFYLPDAKVPRLVPVQRPVEGRWEYFPVTWYDPAYPITGAKVFFSGGAGLSSTAEDYASFLQLYLNGGEWNGRRILSRKTVETIMANQVGELMGGKNAASSYGLAFGVLTEAGQAQGGRGSAGTFDWGGYFNTQYFADPKEQVVGVIMKQTQGTTRDRTGDLFRHLVMQAIDD